jgi:DNA polymerase (family 10)
MLAIPGVGPRRASLLYEALHVDSLDALREAAKAGRVRTVPGFGEKMETHIIEAIDSRQNLKPLLAWLQTTAGTQQAVGASSYRRMRDTVGDLDILITSSDPPAVMQRFEQYEDIERMLASGVTSASAADCSSTSGSFRQNASARQWCTSRARARITSRSGGSLNHRA